MTKTIADDAMDKLLTFLGTATAKIGIATAACATYANFNTYAVGTLADTSTNYTNADGGSSGRKTTHSAATIAVGTTGAITHVLGVTDAGSGTIIWQGTCASTNVTVGGTVILAAWVLDEVGDPT